jgi:hypothetical protein
MKANVCAILIDTGAYNLTCNITHLKPKVK